MLLALHAVYAEMLLFPSLACLVACSHLIHHPQVQEPSIKEPEFFTKACSYNAMRCITSQQRGYMRDVRARRCIASAKCLGRSGCSLLQVLTGVPHSLSLASAMQTLNFRRIQQANFTKVRQCLGTTSTAVMPAPCLHHIYAALHLSTFTPSALLCRLRLRAAHTMGWKGGGWPCSFGSTFRGLRLVRSIAAVSNAVAVTTQQFCLLYRALTVCATCRVCLLASLQC